MALFDNYFKWKQKSESTLESEFILTMGWSLWREWHLIYALTDEGNYKTLKGKETEKLLCTQGV